MRNQNQLLYRNHEYFEILHEFKKVFIGVIVTVRLIGIRLSLKRRRASCIRVLIYGVLLYSHCNH